MHVMNVYWYAESAIPYPIWVEFMALRLASVLPCTFHELPLIRRGEGGGQDLRGDLVDGLGRVAKRHPRLEFELHGDRRSCPKMVHVSGPSPLLTRATAVETATSWPDDERM